MMMRSLLYGVAAAALMGGTVPSPVSGASPASPSPVGGIEPSYFNELGRGNRESFVTFTNTVTSGGPTALDRLVFGHENSASNANTYFDNQSITGRYFRVDFGVGVKKRITEFTWKQDIVSTTGAFSFQGSNDASVWTDIQTGIVLGSSTTQVVSFTNANYYRYYQMIGTSGTTSTAAYLMGWWWKIVDETENTQPSYKSFYTHGLLTNGGCTLSATQPFTGGNETYLFDSFDINNTAYFSTNNATNGYIQVQYPEAVVCSGIKWVQQNSATHGTWKVQGSNDGSVWTDIHTGITLGGGTSTETTFSASASYTYLRLQKTGGLTSSSPYLYQCLFKVVRAANYA